MSHSTGPAHRSISNIRPSINPLGGSGTPSTPHTPLRQISNSFGSPSSLRAEEECVVIEIGCRYMHVGFAGDAGPKAVINFGPEEQRRAGDYRRWQPGYDKAWRERIHGKKWGEAHELWNLDLREVDLGLVGDKIERAIRDAYTKYLLIDSRPRKSIDWRGANHLQILHSKLYPESGLAPLQEEDELRASMKSLHISADTSSDAVATIPLRSTLPPRTLTLPFSKLAQPCEEALLATHLPAPELDDEELPIHLLLYQALLRLPVDLRSEEQFLSIETIPNSLDRPRRSSSSPTEIPSSPSDTPSSPISPTTPRPPAHIPAGHRSPEPDSIASTIYAKSGKTDTQEERGTVRAVTSLGVWSGASLLSQLKIPAVSSVDREVWMQHGMAGANRNAEVSVAAGAGGRTSMGPGAFKSGIGEKDGTCHKPYLTSSYTAKSSSLTFKHPHRVALAQLVDHCAVIIFG
ncbi:hypothetical protein EYC84_004791 [Monilinia fructicola]|uniref:Uncharacterized protein n=1 Tax=Monilinia fructicola TaxID=38448 RepID=A0A5M9K1J8_MONFR|nr:hypothetical protein EYC84_004791 [Monilinia fructicola]